MRVHLNAHQGIHRVVSKSHICIICNMSFITSSKLTEHLVNQHQSYASANVPAESTLVLPVDTSLKSSISQNKTMIPFYQL